MMDPLHDLQTVTGHGSTSLYGVKISSKTIMSPMMVGLESGKPKLV